MAQVEVRVFNPCIPEEVLDDLATVLPKIVFQVHYPEDAIKQTNEGELVLRDGDITSIFYEITTDRSRSNADFELEVSEGSDNWPRDDDGVLLVHEKMVEALDFGATRISVVLREFFGSYSHNIFEVNGVDTGWFQYKPVE